MAGQENAFSGLKIGNITSSGKLYKALETIIPDFVTVDDLHYLCIGTDRATGDAYGPLVGTYLKESGFENVTGTVDDPCHAKNLAERAVAIPDTKYVIAIDSCLGRMQSIGTIQVANGAAKPGAGVNKYLGEYGNANIMGIVDIGGYMEYFVLQNTRLSLVMHLARTTTEAIQMITHSRSATRKEDLHAI